MAQLYSSQANVPESAGAALAPMGMARLTGGEGEEAIGRTLFDIGQKLQALQDARDRAQGIAEYNKLVDEYKESLRTKDPKEWIAGFDSLQGKIGKILQGKSRNVQDELQNRFTIWNQEHRAELARLRISTEVGIAKSELPDIEENFLINNQRDAWERHIDSLVAGGALFPQEKKRLMLDFDNKMAAKTQDVLADAALGKAVSLRTEDGRIDTARAKKLVEDTPGLSAEKKLETIKKITDWDNQEKIDNDKFWTAQQGETTRQWQSLLDSGKFTELKENIRKYNLSLPAEYQTKISKFKQEWMKIAEGALKQEGDIVTDQRVRASLYAEANNISLGNIKVDDFFKKLNDARYVQHKINDDDYKALSTAATEEVSKGRAQALNSYSQQAMRTIGKVVLAGDISDPQVMLAAMLTKGVSPEQQIRFKYVNLYMDDLRDWLRKNPNKTAAEFDVYAKEQLVRSESYSVQEMQRRVENRSLKILGEPIPPSNNIIRRNDGESIADYLRRTGK